ncbi:hypothetical protein [Jiangella mangrovi]|uniref:Uncharacterized protein n=1 Tax=Jiangella mangrovi TaxID=1524084 RepID=A0A7W9GP23_9ACTN|nr:hypothetical protein [Jiangella mangrovi]MBB5787445.1 hypothetical protein [Jiangella mangrovi]
MTSHDLDRRTAEAEAWLDTLDPGRTPADDTADLAAIAAAVTEVAAAEERVRAAVRVARANGRSWARIGLALGVSRQSAHERFGTRTDVT